MISALSLVGRNEACREQQAKVENIAAETELYVNRALLLEERDKRFCVFVCLSVCVCVSAATFFLCAVQLLWPIFPLLVI